MALTKRHYTDEETLITAKNLNDIQDAVIALEDGLFTVDDYKSGEVINITDAAQRGFRSLNIYGKTTQDGTPTPDAPVELVSIGSGGSITVDVTGNDEAQSMTLATPNGLPGIPVTSGGNYTDANGQQWICDEIDFAGGKLIKRCGHYVFNGSEQWSDILTSTVNGTRYVRTPVARSEREYDTNILCNLGGGQRWEGSQYTLFINGYEYFAVGGDALRGAETVSDFKGIIAETPIELVYKLATPIEIPLSAEEIAAYSDLHTYRDHTTVSNDASAHMELEYVMDAKKYIDSLVGSGTIHPATVE